VLPQRLIPRIVNKSVEDTFKFLASRCFLGAEGSYFVKKLLDHRLLLEKHVAADDKLQALVDITDMILR